MATAGLRVLAFYCVIVKVIAQYADYESVEKDSTSVEKNGFVEPLDFSPLFTGQFGLNGAASNPSASIFQNPTKKPSSIFDISDEVPSTDRAFSPENFGFIPVLSQGIAAATTTVQPKRYHEKTIEIERTKATAKTSTINKNPVNFDIKTVHNKEYRKHHVPEKPSAAYKEKSNYYISPTLSEFQATSSSNIVKPASDLPYSPITPSQQSLPINSYQGYQVPQTVGLEYKPYYNRFKRYSGKRKKNAKLRKAKKKKDDEDDDEHDYDYYNVYKSRPKAFDSDHYSSDFDSYEKAELKADPEYGTDEEYSSDEYERIKAISEKQAEKVKQNPDNCKKVVKDTMTCMVCQNPKSGGSYESCSYVSEPKNNKYAYVKAQKYDSEDDPENQEEETQKSENEEAPEQSQKLRSTVSPPSTTTTNYRTSSRRPIKPTYPVYGAKLIQGNVRNKPQTQPNYDYDGFDAQNPTPSSSTPAKYEAQKEEAEEEDDEDEGEEEEEGDEDEEEGEEEETNDNEKNSKENDEDEDEYQYKAPPIPDFFTDNEQKKNVEYVLAEFAKKDRTACKKVVKGEMTCYQCTDSKGLKNEECMFVQESAPKSSHLAYKEVKEYNLKPTTQPGQVQALGNIEESESQIISQPSPTVVLPTISSTYLPLDISFPLKKKHFPLKKFNEQSDSIPKIPSIIKAGGHLYIPPINLLGQNPTATSSSLGILKRNARSKGSKVRQQAKALDDFAEPSEFAGDDSKGAFWAETKPKFSRALGVSLPSYMLEKSEGEALVDEHIASG